MLLVQYLTDNPSHTHIYILPSILLEPNCPLELRLDLHLALVPSYTLAPPTSLATFVLFTFRIYFRKIIDLGRHYRCRRRRMANETNQEQQKLSITFHDLLLKMSSEVQIHKNLADATENDMCFCQQINGKQGAKLNMIFKALLLITKVVSPNRLI